MKCDFPNMAIVTGAAKNGAMQYANSTAREHGITTIGIANHIIGQETTEADLDAATFFNQDGFNPRQELMARTGTIPFVGPGAQGSEFEGSLERTHAKIGKSPLPPITYIDPVGLGPNGQHWWAPVSQLEEQFGTQAPLPDGGVIQMSRSPFVRNLVHLERSYLDAYERQILPYVENPLRYWEQAGVPEKNIRTAMERAVRDSIYTGLPVPSYLQPVIKKLHLA
jgi:hypothetical protein